MKKGVYDISIEEYHAGEGISRSTLFEFMKSPLHYYYKANNKEIKEKVPIIKKINALEFGDALHTYILERDDFNKRYFVIPKINRTTKSGKALHAVLMEESAGKDLIDEEAYQELCLMGLSIEANEMARCLIQGAQYEKSLFWTDPDAELLCKVRPDIWHSNFICDLKTTQSASLRDFQRSVYAFGYHIQAGMIQEAIKHVQGVLIKDFVFVAIEKEPPYAVAIYQLDEAAVDLGVKQFKDTIMSIRTCIDANNWPSYPAGVIDVPRWAFTV